LNPTPTRAAILAALAGFVIGAHAEPGRYPPTYVQVGLGAGVAETNTYSANQGTTSVMAGFRFNQYVGVQAIGFEINNVQHRPANPPAPFYEFERFWGGQLVGFVPLTSYWDFYGEIGGGQSRTTSATPGASPQDKTDGLTGAGLRWQILDHVAVTLDVTRLWNARVTNGTLRAELNF
jgi:hypothetical protein